ncbi:hypothetical protein [Roseimicrobium sp. ORNL1]|uniref:hypothetical protein n=1 Tax=Roseimicrobium sp. ORNL1 TaxID=2711231 RepID=UPI0013E15B1E|nr:hypothetical protein [Roseimicrobium sp. ORNL1]QIF01773.1 hypothetical protein G5S37_09625 [Roseimicrobium sp. ORNL1]
MNQFFKAVLIAFFCAFFPQQAPAAPEVTPLEVTKMKPESPAKLPLGEKFTVSIRYHNPGPNPVQVFARPYTKGASTRGYGAHPCEPRGKGRGKVEGWFVFDAKAKVDEIVITMVDSKTKQVSATLKVPVDLTWE